MLGAFMVLSLLPQWASAGFGVSPSRILEDRAIKGSVIERVVYFVQGTPDRDLEVEITVDDGDIKDWITADPIGQQIIPKGTQQYPVKVRITVPEDAPLGLYKGYVRVVGAPPKTDPNAGSSVSIAVGARVEIDLTVGAGIHYEYAIRDIDLKDIKEIDHPKASITIENKGNVKAGPKEASFELFNKYGDIRLAYVQGIQLEQIQPFVVDNTIVEFPISVGLSVGEYWGMVRLYNDKGELVREFKDIFNVSEATFFDRHGKQIGVGLGILVLLILLTVVFRRSRRRRS